MLPVVRVCQGYFDGARHRHASLTRYYEMDLSNFSNHSKSSLPTSVFVNDLRTDGTCCSSDSYDIVARAWTALASASANVMGLLVMDPGGLVGRPHAVGGGWVAPGTGVTFYFARDASNSTDGVWRRYLCADINVRGRCALPGLPPYNPW